MELCHVFTQPLKQTVSGYRSRIRWRPWRPPPLLHLRRLSNALCFKMIDFRALLGIVLGLFLGCLGSSFARQHFLWAISGCLGPFLKPLGPFFGHLGHLLGCLGPSPTSPGACLGPA